MFSTTLKIFPTVKLYVLIKKKSLIHDLVLVQLVVLVADPCLCTKQEHDPNDLKQVLHAKTTLHRLQKYSLTSPAT